MGINIRSTFAALACPETTPPREKSLAKTLGFISIHDTVSATTFKHEEEEEVFSTIQENFKPPKHHPKQQSKMQMTLRKPVLL